MTQLFTEGFATYGLGSGAAINQAMLSGRWGSMFSGGFTNVTLGTLPWDASDTDIYMSSQQSAHNEFGPRVVLPATAVTCIVSLYFAVDTLPSTYNYGILSFCDVYNNAMITLAVGTTGALFLYAGSALLGISSGPVLTPESATHIEVSLTTGTSPSLTCQANGVTVLTWSASTTLSGVAQVRFMDLAAGYGVPTNSTGYVGNVIIRNALGTYNNGIVGDRRVATLFVSADDLANQGWTPRPLQRFGTGVLDNTANANSGVSAAASSAMDIGSGQFTIEGNFRIGALPSGSNTATLFSLWDAANNHRSYELYINGPSTEGGNIVFRISTDGTTSTVTEIVSWPFQWETGAWYHIAIARDGSNNTRFFVNGVMQGLPVADAHTYFAGNAAGAQCCLGAEFSGAAVSGTSFDGWQDEFRLTIGACRYTANFSPPTGPFPRGGSDANWAQVQWISGWDAGLLDESSAARTLTSWAGATPITPNDGSYGYQVLDKSPAPNDNTFIEAALIAATDVLTYTALPTASAVVRVGTKDGTAAANYTWVTSLTAAFQVLIGGSVAASMSNLAAAINAGAGAGTVYGSGTTANYDVTANVLPSNQLQAVASTPGAAGNSIVATSTDSHGTWATGTLTGGANIPSYSQFAYRRLPSNTTIVDSAQILTRSWKTDAGLCTVQASFVGAEGGVLNGAANPVTTVPGFYGDMFETDPDTSTKLSPTTVLLGKIRINRTT